MTLRLNWDDLIIQYLHRADCQRWLGCWSGWVTGRVLPVYMSKFGDWFLQHPDASTSTVRLPVRSDFVRQRGFPNRFVPSRSHLHHDGFGSVFVPYLFPCDEPFGYEQRDAEAVTTPAVILQPDERQSQTPEPPVPKAKVIDIPGAANSTAAKNATADDIHLGKRRATGNSPVCAHSKQFVCQH
jgi:hypothetical protein